MRGGWNGPRGCVGHADRAVRDPEPGAGRGGRYRWRVGFNPYRGRVARRTDLALVALALVVVVALVLWAVFG